MTNTARLTEEENREIDYMAHEIVYRLRATQQHLTELTLFAERIKLVYLEQGRKEVIQLLIDNDLDSVVKGEKWFEDLVAELEGK